MQKVELYILLKNRHKNLISGFDRIQKVSRPFWIGLLSLLVILIVGSLLLGSVYYIKVASNLPSLYVLPVLLNPTDGELLEPTRIMDQNNKEVLMSLDNPNIPRLYLSINPDEEKHINPQLLRAVVAKLDPEFWQNPGFSIRHFNNPEPVTIAERLVNDLLLWNEPDSALRPLRMRLLAAQVVRTFGRTQVLEWYLNSVYFGHRAYGAESAAQLYFSKSAQDLSLAEAALLAVLIESPALNPLDAKENTLELQHDFLAEMALNQIITTDEFSSALHQELTLRKSIEDPSSSAPDFTHRVLQQLEFEFGERRLERGGLIIQTTLDADLQKEFTCTARSQMLRLENPYDTNLFDTGQECRGALLLPTQLFSDIDLTSLSTAGLIMDPQMGDVLAYLEPINSSGEIQRDPDYEPGSLLTPFAAAAAFARGFSPASLKWDVPTNDIETTDLIVNPDGSYHGPVSLRSAIANDYLIPVAEVIKQTGTSNVWTLASASGLNSISDAPDSTSPIFFGQTTSLLELGAAYSTLANSGILSGVENLNSRQIEPNFVKSVKTVTFRTLLDHSTPAVSTVLSEPLAYLVNHVLSDESARWPSLGFPNPLEIGETAAAKIGQISSKQQVWTVGYTPQRVVLVWMGTNRNEEEIQKLDGRMAAGIWHAMIKLALEETADHGGWIEPQGITKIRVCEPSGMLPTANCANTRAEVFLTGNQPTIADTLFQKIEINRETGQRATVFTNPELVEEKIVMDVPTNARQWAINTGLPVAPSGYDAIPSTETNPDVVINIPVIFSSVSGKVSIIGNASGSDFSSYMVQVGEGINPTNWQQIGSTSTTPVTNGELAVWETKNLNGLYAIRLNVIKTNQEIQTSIIQVTVDNTPPQVHITYPQDGQTIESVRGTITLSIDIQDEVNLGNVEWHVDDRLVSTQTSPPFVLLFDASKGKHTLLITAWDAAGNKTTTDKIQFTVEK